MNDDEIKQQYEMFLIEHPELLNAEERERWLFRAWCELRRELTMAIARSIR